MNGMVPREHGAYGQLLVPLITALAVGRPGVAAAALAIAIVAAFLAHEPLLVLIGQRGARAARDRRGAAMRWLAVSAGIAVVLGGAASVMVDTSVRVALLVPLVGAVALGTMIAVRKEHSSGGEIVAAATLSSLAAPVALAAGGSVVAAVTCAVVFAAGFVIATIAVREVIAQTRRRTVLTRTAIACGAAAIVGGLVVLSRFEIVAGVAPVAAAPMSAGAAALAIVLPAPRHLRKVGWLLVGATVITSGALLVGLR